MMRDSARAAVFALAISSIAPAPILGLRLNVPAIVYVIKQRCRRRHRLSRRRSGLR